MSDYQAIITQAGLNKAIDADQNGVSIKVTHIAAGTSGYMPSVSKVSLASEAVRIPVSGGKNVSNTQIHLTGLFDTGEFSCRELGFFLEDGTLFAIWSHPTNVLFYKTELNTVVQSFDLVLSAVPPGSITVDTTGDLSLIYSTEFVQFATAIMDNMMRQIEQRDAINNMAAELNLSKPLKG